WSLLTTTDAGSTWNNLDISSPTIVAINPQNPKILYTANQQSDQGPYGAFFKSINGGSNWNRAVTGLPELIYINSIVLDSTNPNVIYAGTDQGVFRSSDAAATWNSAGLRETFTFALA